EEHHQHRRHAQKRPERQLVIRSLALGHHKSQPENASQHRSSQNRQQRSLHPQKRSRHQHHFHVAQAHPFAPAQPEVSLRAQPQQPASEGRSQQGVGQREHRRRRRGGE